MASGLGVEVVWPADRSEIHTKPDGPEKTADVSI
jgi:hypothetical protein